MVTIPSHSYFGADAHLNPEPKISSLKQLPDLSNRSAKSPRCSYLRAHTIGRIHYFFFKTVLFLIGPLKATDGADVMYLMASLIPDITWYVFIE